MRTLRAAALATVALGGLAALAGCGEIKSPDLFIVYRSGAAANARLTLIVTEEGGVTCDGRQAGRLEDPQIIKARTILEDLKQPASEHLSLPSRPGSVLQYRLRDEDGSVRFSDNSASQPQVLRELALFVLQTAQQRCGLPE